MKKQIELREYFFEKIELALPSFPGQGKPIRVDSISRKYTVFFNKKKSDRVALRWILEFHSKRQGKAKSSFALFVSIIGIFRVPSSNTKKVNAHLVITSGCPLMYETVKSEIERFLLHSLLKPAKLPVITFK